MAPKHQIIAWLCSLLATTAGAQTRVAPLADPWLPTQARAAAVAPETRGAALRAQVLAKLERQFQQADRSGRGALSLDEAQRAGWGFAVQNFDALDVQGRGEIRLQDVQRFIQRPQLQQ
jgi:hypothetical protein